MKTFWVKMMGELNFIDISFLYMLTKPEQNFTVTHNEMYPFDVYIC